MHSTRCGWARCASASCSPGLAIGTIGLFLTSVSGEVTVVSGNERLDIEVVIVAGKSLPVIGPLVTATGTVGFQPNPLQFDIGGTINVLVFEIAGARRGLDWRAGVRGADSNQQSLFYQDRALTTTNYAAKCSMVH